jgi:hypothetical protein
VVTAGANGWRTITTRNPLPRVARTTSAFCELAIEAVPKAVANTANSQLVMARKFMNLILSKVLLRFHNSGAKHLQKLLIL